MYNYSYKLELKPEEQGRDEGEAEIEQYHMDRTSPLFQRISDASAWLREKEGERESEPLLFPNTKWRFVEFKTVDLKVVYDREPLLGARKLPQWLSNQAHSRATVALDEYDDNLCVWR